MNEICSLYGCKLASLIRFISLIHLSTSKLHLNFGFVQFRHAPYSPALLLIFVSAVLEPLAQWTALMIVLTVDPRFAPELTIMNRL